LSEHCAKQRTVINFQKEKYNIANNFLTVQDKKSKQKHNIFKINKGSHTEI
jgi:hypothetical protein